MRYQRCTQGFRTVSGYTKEFHRLAARNNLNESNNHLVARFIRRLKDSIHDRLELSSVWSMAQAVNFAMKIEMQQSRQNRTPYNRRHWHELVVSGKGSTSVAISSHNVGPSAPAVTQSNTLIDP
ncbi:hypothetical protein KFK09_024279 [Dendrobium nobile]|uniref:Retrotransposon gag domain-containing protein n=1 Tax=Dendrobium nobile TaxID=94219 RepID=A0A8T3ADE7_DENNO|nr:hypothetical protein KFK09_024279 [Dendrobium nobile]